MENLQIWGMPQSRFQSILFSNLPDEHMTETLPHSHARHHCLIYRGAPSLQLPVMARMIKARLEENLRCLYLNSPTMVTGLKSYLFAAGVDVDYECTRSSLLLSSDRSHLRDGREFSIEMLMDGLEQALQQALDDGYAGLWATGDMTWELGPEVGSGKLLEYECRLEQFFRTHPEMGGVCQYHIDSLPGFAVREGVQSHPKFFINDTLSMLNPHFAAPGTGAGLGFSDEQLDAFIHHLAETR